MVIILRSFTISKFLCIQCDSSTFLPRKLSKKKELGHLKKLYCLKCKEEVNHLEKRESEWGAEQS